MSKFEKHVFVCVTQRPETGKPSCTSRGGAAIFEALQAGLGERPELWDKVAITTCGCLGPCFDGPTVVVYPEGVWYAGVRPDDAAEIVDSHLAGGVPVERLRYAWPED
jgi:(2Fe-2S) ferredoxin